MMLQGPAEVSEHPLLQRWDTSGGGALRRFKGGDRSSSSLHRSRVGKGLVLTLFIFPLSSSGVFPGEGCWRQGRTRSQPQEGLV